jgi:hypothetical protein
MKKCVYSLMLISPAIVFLILSFGIYEEHPFSRFAMYSSFPETADYYYFALEDGTPISGLKAGVVSLAQLKDIMVRRIERDGLSYDSLSLAHVGVSVLDSICPTIQLSEMSNDHAIVLLMYRNMRLSSNGNVEQKEFTLATCRLN